MPVVVATSCATGAEPGVPPYGKKNPYPARALKVELLNRAGSAKETVHLELELGGSGMTYQPGDALAVVSANRPERVGMLLEACGLSGDEPITGIEGVPRRLADALRDDYDITGLSRKVLGKLAEACGSDELLGLVAEDAAERYKEYVSGREILDAIRDFAPRGLSAQSLAGLFRKLPPRLYSIASSPLVHPGEVHLTVAAVRYEAHGIVRHGVCSTFLADRVQPGDVVSVFVQPNKNFRLPEDPATSIIMVGPGTGVAPFRAFAEHRAAIGAGGRNWLFMGDQRAEYDFLYQCEWERRLKDGTLARLDVAFSRDQQEKIYVQHRIREKAAELYAWLQEGACVYVCGDASRMAVAVHEALLDCIAGQGARSRNAAEAYLDEMKQAKRYQRDVY